jgi:hypothetical protein
MSYKTHMDGDREPHSGIVPTKRSNAGQGGPKEIVEGRPLTKENAEQLNPCRTQGRPYSKSGEQIIDMRRRGCGIHRIGAYPRGFSLLKTFASNYV